MFNLYSDINIEKVNNLYKLCDSISHDDSFSEKSISLYRRWHGDACALFCKYFNDNDNDFYRFKHFDLSGNGYVLHSQFRNLSSLYKILIAKMEKESIDNKTKKEIFIVHGHDDSMKNEISSFLGITLGLKVTILSEEPNEGRTIIQKLEDLSKNANFAIILLSPDDYGAKVGEEPKGRARQNVIFEWGFFTAKLGMNNVCAILKDNVEMPSDIGGVLHIKFDKDWKFNLQREINNAGIKTYNK